jgi:hypothetical protein
VRRVTSQRCLNRSAAETSPSEQADFSSTNLRDRRHGEATRKLDQTFNLANPSLERSNRLSSGINPLAIANFACEVRTVLVARKHPVQQVEIFILEGNDLLN